MQCSIKRKELEEVILNNNINGVKTHSGSFYGIPLPIEIDSLQRKLANYKESD